jgi:hypothetical protein
MHFSSPVFEKCIDPSAPKTAPQDDNIFFSLRNAMNPSAAKQLLIARIIEEVGERRKAE